MRHRRRKQNTAVRPGRQHLTLQHVMTWMSVAVILALIVLAIVYRKDITIENIVGFTPSNLWLAALVFMGLYALKSLTAVVYVKLIYIAAGIVFPLPVALLVNILGTAVQLSLPYILGRAGGRSAAEAIVQRYPKLGRVSALRQRSNFWFATFTRAVGLFPADPVSVYFGACGMPYFDFLLGSSLGLIPTMIVSTIVGTEANDPGSVGFIVSAALFIVLQAGSVIAFFFWIRKNNAAIAAAEKGESIE